MINYLILIKIIVTIDPENRLIQGIKRIKQEMYTLDELLHLFKNEYK